MIQDIFSSITNKIVDSASEIILAFLMLIVGWIGAAIIAKIVSSFLNRIRLNQILKRIGWEDAFSKIDTPLDIPKFFGELSRWFFVLLVLMACSYVLDFDNLSRLLEKTVSYYPNIFISAIIFVIAVFLVDFSSKIMVGSLEKEKIVYSKFLGNIIRIAIWFLAILAILYQLRITPSLVLVIFIGLVSAISIAFGVSFGLGSKDLVSKFLKDVENKFKE